MFCQAICPLNFPMGMLWELTSTQTAKTSRINGKTRVANSGRTVKATGYFRRSDSTICGYHATLCTSQWRSWRDIVTALNVAKVTGLF
jgi:hypothetical protein